MSHIYRGDVNDFVTLKIVRIVEYLRDVINGRLFITFSRKKFDLHDCLVAETLICNIIYSLCTCTWTFLKPYTKVKLRCDTRFQRAFTACGCVYKGVMLIH